MVRHKQRMVSGIVCAFLISLLIQTILSMWNDAPTFDEMVNPSVGYAELVTGELGLVNDHPPLIRVFTALPLLTFRPTVPLDHDSWSKRGKGIQDRYGFAHQFFYVANDDADRMLFWARVPVVFLSLLLGLFVFKWAKELYGNLAGLFALFLYSFEPNIIAHSRLTTNDLILALFLFLTIYQFWQYLREPTLKDLIFTGILFGFALVSKFSAIMLLPMILLLAFIISNAEVSASNGAEKYAYPIKKYAAAAGMALKATSLISMAAVGVILVFYGSQWRLYIRGFYDTVAHYQGGHSAFLTGSYSTDGWWYYFPVAFALKTPIPLLIFIITAFLFLSFRKEKAECFLLIPISVIIVSALLSHLNIGIRHILPIYPFLIVLASSAITIRFSSPRFFAGLFIGLIIWYLFSTVSIFPSYLAYFNEFVGPGNGYKMLADSNLDWGQDLKRLKFFMDEKGIKKVYLSYFGTADPCYYGIKFVFLPGSPSPCVQQVTDESPPDFLAVSVTNLQSVYLYDKKTFEWLKSYNPITQIGYSIFIYDIKGDASAHNNLGILYLRYGMLEEALYEFKLVVELAPKESMAYANLGLTYTLLSLLDKAKESFKKAIELDPENSMAKEGLGRVGGL